MHGGQGLRGRHCERVPVVRTGVWPALPALSASSYCTKQRARSHSTGGTREDRLLLFPLPTVSLYELFSNALRILNEFSRLQNAQHFLRGFGGGTWEEAESGGEAEMHRLIREEWKPWGRGGHFIGGPLFKDIRTKAGPPTTSEKGRSQGTEGNALPGGPRRGSCWLCFYHRALALTQSFPPITTLEGTQTPQDPRGGPSSHCWC